VARLPFNPNDLPDRDVGKPARRERKGVGADAAASALTVTQVTLLIKDTLADHTPRPLRVVGEISNFSERGHWYLSLKDEENVLSGVMWKSAAGKVGFQPQRGMKVVATGRLDYYGPQARLQMYLDKLEPVGQGELERRFRQLCDQLRELGYFAPEHKLAMPSFPRHLAIITSEKGAAVQDVIRTARHRWPGIRLSVVDVPVQGASAAPKIARAIAAVDARHERLGIDAIVLTRGGGSIEDLWAFNERIVADAVNAATVPIVAAIGHEVDTTIAELAADLRCSTPTQAAERLVPDVRAEHQRLEQLAHRLRTGLRRRAEVSRSRLVSVARHAFFRQPAKHLAPRQEQLKRLADLLARVLQVRLRQGRHDLLDLSQRLGEVSPKSQLALARQRLEAMRGRLTTSTVRQHREAASTIRSLERQLTSVGPRSVLKRGYSYTTDAKGRLIRRTDDVTAGDRVTTHLADGTFDAQVLGEGEPKPVGKPTRSRKSRQPPQGPQQSLFG